MDELLREIVKQVPSLAVLAWIVKAFLTALSKRDENLKTLGDNCHQFQRDMHESNKVMVEDFKEHVRVQKQTIHQIEEHFRRCPASTNQHPVQSP